MLKTVQLAPPPAAVWNTVLDHALIHLDIAIDVTVQCKVTSHTLP